MAPTNALTQFSDLISTGSSIASKLNSGVNRDMVFNLAGYTSTVSVLFGSALSWISSANSYQSANNYAPSQILDQQLEMGNFLLTIQAAMATLVTRAAGYVVNGFFPKAQTFVQAMDLQLLDFEDVIISQLGNSMNLIVAAQLNALNVQILADYVVYGGAGQSIPTVTVPGVSSTASVGASSAPSGGASSAHSGGASSAPSGGASSAHSGGASSAPSGGASSAPSGGASSAPSGGASSVPSGGASSAPSGGASSAPSGGASSAPSGGASSAPSGGASSAPSGGASSAPSGGASSAPSGGVSTSAPAGSGQSTTGYATSTQGSKRCLVRPPGDAATSTAPLF